MKIKLILFAFVFILFYKTDLNGDATQKSTIIYLTRHGQTHWNERKLWQGTSDTTLNLEGINQAMQKALHFKDMPIDAIYSSPLQRAYLTAEIIASVHEKTPIASFGLMEPWAGKLEGMHAKEIHALIEPRLNSMSQEERRNAGDLEGLMSVAMISERTETELKKFGNNHPGKIVVAVSHSGIIKAIVAMHTDAIPETVKMSNMAYLKYAYDGEKLTLQEISPDITFHSYKRN